MNSRIRIEGGCLAMVAALMMVLAGCAPPSAPKDEKSATKAEKGKHEHPKEGPHGGPLAEWGDEEFHVEYVIDSAAKRATIYILDDSARKAPPDDPRKFKDVKMTIANPLLVLELKHDPKVSSDKGIAFTATHDTLGKSISFKGTISAKYDGKEEPYSGDFAVKAPK